MEKAKESQKERYSHPPVVSVLGHVDHGKTTLLDAIRKTNQAAGEAGGITQSIGASSIEISHDGKNREITFIDTPGHVAFSNMRSHGVSASDIALLVIAADDGIKPQTKESLEIIKNAGVPYIIVFTKSDAPGANIEKVKQEVLKEGVSLEGLGGDVPFIAVSAKIGDKIKELLDLILIVYDISEIKKDDNENFQGVVIESRLDKKKGPVSTIIVKKGTVTYGMKLFLGSEERGKVRAIFDTNLKQVQTALPGDAVEILGISGVLHAGSVLYGSAQEKIAEEKSIISKMETHHDLLRKIQMQEKEKLPLIIKTRTSGEYEAVLASLPDSVEVVFEGKGDISVTDIMMAKDFSAIVIGFNVGIEKQAEMIANSQNIFFRTYTIIYKLLEEIEDAAALILEKGIKKVAGKAKIIAQFEGTSGTIIGIKVEEGRVQVGDAIQKEDSEERIAKVVTIRQAKEDVKQVGKGKECGMMTDPQIDFTIGDVLIFLPSKKIS